MPSSPYDINRKHSVDSRYFDNLQTEEQAYWLGFIWADGHIGKTAKRCSGPNRLTISQKISEKDHLDKLQDALRSDYPMRVQASRNGGMSLLLSINSRPLCARLETLGFGTKEHRTKVPNMPHELVRHFIRGYFDGDGCLSIYEQTVGNAKVNKQEWSLTGNPELISEIRAILENEANVTNTVKTKTYKRTDKAVTLRYGKASDIEKLYAYLYEDATIHMPTKHEKFMSYFKRKSEKRTPRRRSSSSGSRTREPST